jgi:hypothetical protein
MAFGTIYTIRKTGLVELDPPLPIHHPHHPQYHPHHPKNTNDDHIKHSRHHAWVPVHGFGFRNAITASPVVLQEDPNHPGSMPSDDRALDADAPFWVPGVGKIEPLSVRRALSVWWQAGPVGGRVRGSDQSWRQKVEWSDYWDGDDGAGWDVGEQGRHLWVHYEETGEFVHHKEGAHVGGVPAPGLVGEESQNVGFQPEADEEVTYDGGFNQRGPGFQQGSFEPVAGDHYQNEGFPGPQPDDAEFHQGGFPQEEDPESQNQGFPGPSQTGELQQGDFQEVWQNNGFDETQQAPPPQSNGFTQGGFQQTATTAYQNKGFQPTVDNSTAKSLGAGINAAASTGLSQGGFQDTQPPAAQNVGFQPATSTSGAKPISAALGVTNATSAAAAGAQSKSQNTGFKPASSASVQNNTSTASQNMGFQPPQQSLQQSVDPQNVGYQPPTVTDTNPQQVANGAPAPAVKKGPIMAMKTPVAGSGSRSGKSGSTNTGGTTTNTTGGDSGNTGTTKTTNGPTQGTGTRSMRVTMMNGFF